MAEDRRIDCSDRKHVAVGPVRTHRKTMSDLAHETANGRSIVVHIERRHVDPTAIPGAADWDRPASSGRPAESGALASLRSPALPGSPAERTSRIHRLETAPGGHSPAPFAWDCGRRTRTARPQTTQRKPTATMKAALIIIGDPPHRAVQRRKHLRPRSGRSQYCAGFITSKANGQYNSISAKTSASSARCLARSAIAFIATPNQNNGKSRINVRPFILEREEGDVRYEVRYGKPRAARSSGSCAHDPKISV